MNPNSLTMGTELIISVPNPTDVVATQMKQGLANHLTDFFNA
jgi:hypothetical protein